jgi:hypothetical protein
MRTNYVLVDLENVSDVDLRLLKREEVRVIIFVGPGRRSWVHVRGWLFGYREEMALLRWRR